MGISYENLYKTEEVSFVARKYLYKEETNVFSYYIIGSNVANKCIVRFTFIFHKIDVLIVGSM